MPKLHCFRTSVRCNCPTLSETGNQVGVRFLVDGSSLGRVLPSIVKIMRRTNVHYVGKVGSSSMLKQEVDYSIDCCKGLIYYRRSEKREHLLVLSIYDTKIGLNYRVCFKKATYFCNGNAVVYSSCVKSNVNCFKHLYLRHCVSNRWRCWLHSFVHSGTGRIPYLGTVWSCRSLQTSTRIVHEIRLRSLPSTSLPIHYSLPQRPDWLWGPSSFLFHG